MEKYSPSLLTEPGTFISAGAAGVVGRALALPFDMGGPKGPILTLARRAPQWALFLGLYVPLESRVNRHFKDPAQKMFSTFFLGAFAGWWMRALCNPISRVSDEMLRTGDGAKKTVIALKNKTVLQFWYATHPILGGLFYFGCLMTAFEGTRRFIERNFIAQDSLKNAVLTNGIAGAVGAGVASTVAFPYSAHRYVHTVIHDSSICRGLLPTLLKEVPMCAGVFASFTLFQSVLSPDHWPRGGFGA